MTVESTTVAPAMVISMSEFGVASNLAQEPNKRIRFDSSGRNRRITLDNTRENRLNTPPLHFTVSSTDLFSSPCTVLRKTDYHLSHVNKNDLAAGSILY